MRPADPHAAARARARDRRIRNRALPDLRSWSGVRRPTGPDPAWPDLDRPVPKGGA